jgi:hypothetical protein
MGEDELALLLPDASVEERAEMRRTILALRLLRDDARVREAQRVEPSWWLARGELERLERRRRARALEALLHAHLSAQRSADSFLDLGPSPMEHALAWRLLLAENALDPPWPPAPSEPAPAVIQRLLDAARRGGAAPEWYELWSLRAAQVLEPGAEAERAWKRALRAAGKGSARTPLAVHLAAGLTASALDRFTPRRALALRSERPELVALDLALRRLVGWSALCCGELESARELLAPCRDPRARLPRPLAELRAAVPEWAELLVGAEPVDARSESETSPTDRRALGSILLAVFAQEDGQQPRLLRLDAARGLLARVQRRLASARRPWSTLAPRRLRRIHQRGAGAGPLHEALGGARTLALAQAPVNDAAGSPLGWLQLECEHHLLPSSPRIEALARALARDLCGASPRLLMARAEARAVSRALSPGIGQSDAFVGPDPKREFADRLRVRLGPLPDVRALWIESDKDGGERVYELRPGDLPASAIAETGADGAGRIRERDARSSRRVRAEAAVTHGRSLAVSMTDARRERVLGVLALESESSAALPENVVHAARAALRELEPLWWCTAYRAANLARDGDDLAWDPESHFLSTLEPALPAAADSRTPLLVLGAPGSGRRTLARWLHFRGPFAAQDIVEGTDARNGGSRILELDGLEPAAQRELAQRLGEGAGERLVLLSQAPAKVLRARGLLVSELERRIDPLPLVVPALRERRDEIPALVQVLAGNVARREALAPARFSDEALGHLWRQDWPGGVAELRSLAAQLVRAGAGRELGAAEVRAAFRARHIDSRERLPLRRASPLDLELALASTRHRIGSENRARAARYLGWDPATLESRLGELGRRGARRKEE